MSHLCLLAGLFASSAKWFLMESDRFQFESRAGVGKAVGSSGKG